MIFKQCVILILQLHFINISSKFLPHFIKSNANITVFGDQFMLHIQSDEICKISISATIIKSYYSQYINTTIEKDLPEDKFNTVYLPIKPYPSTTYIFVIKKCTERNGNFPNLCEELPHIISKTLPENPDITNCSIFDSDKLVVNIVNVQIRNSIFCVLAYPPDKHTNFENVMTYVKENIPLNGGIVYSQNASSAIGSIEIKLRLNRHLMCKMQHYIYVGNEYEGNTTFSVIKFPENPCTTEEYQYNDVFQIIPTTETNHTVSTESNNDIIITLERKENTLWNAAYFGVATIVAALFAVIIFAIALTRKIYSQKKSEEDKELLEETNTREVIGRDIDVQDRIFRNILEHSDTQTITNEISEEFQKIPLGVPQELYGGLLLNKNRDNSILPYEFNRVVLSLKVGNPDSDYINASYIKGFNLENKYIATQGPKSKTIPDFWRMVWERRIFLIVMLVNIVENGTCNCEEYWAENGGTKYGEITVFLQKITRRIDYTIRDLTISNNNIKRHIKHIHFKNWPSNGCPTTPYSLVKFLRAVRKYKTKNPILVHCSSGVGRTGAFILCDYIIDMAKTGRVNVPQALFALRSCRKFMVKSQIYYLYCYCVINEYFNGYRPISLENFKKNYPEIIGDIINNNHLFERKYWLNLIHHCKGHPNWKYNKNKQRNEEEPLSSYEFIATERYYIDAVEIPLNSTKIINTLQPLPKTVRDFWRMVYDREVSLILSLHTIDENDSTSIEFWPTINQPTLKPIDFIEATLIKTETKNEYDYYHILVQDKYLKCEKYVHLIHFNSWERGEKLPNLDNFLNFYNYYRLYKGNDSVAVACCDATQGCSIFFMFLVVLENLQQDLTLDLFESIGRLQYYRRSLFVDKEALKFILDAAHKFLTQDVPEYQNMENCV